MEQSPSLEADSRSASQKISHLKVHYCIHKRLPMVSILSQMNASDNVVVILS